MYPKVGENVDVHIGPVGVYRGTVAAVNPPTTQKGAYTFDIDLGPKFGNRKHAAVPLDRLVWPIKNDAVPAPAPDEDTPGQSNPTPAPPPPKVPRPASPAKSAGDVRTRLAHINICESVGDPGSLFAAPLGEERGTVDEEFEVNYSVGEQETLDRHSQIRQNLKGFGVSSGFVFGSGGFGDLPLDDFGSEDWPPAAPSRSNSYDGAETSMGTSEEAEIESERDRVGSDAVAEQRDADETYPVRHEDENGGQRDSTDSSAGDTTGYRFDDSWPHNDGDLSDETDGDEDENDDAFVKDGGVVCQPAPGYVMACYVMVGMGMGCIRCAGSSVVRRWVKFDGRPWWPCVVFNSWDAVEESPLFEEMQPPDMETSPAADEVTAPVS